MLLKDYYIKDSVEENGRKPLTVSLKILGAKTN
jgi:hypothetical protein